MTAVKGYVLQDSEGEEFILVVRTHDIELLYSLLKRMSRMRDRRLKDLGKAIEEDLNAKH